MAAMEEAMDDAFVALLFRVSKWAFGFAVLYAASNAGLFVLGGAVGAPIFSTDLDRRKAAQRVSSTVHAILGVRTFLRVVWLEHDLATDPSGRHQPMAAMGQQVDIDMGYYLVDTLLDVAVWATQRRVVVGDLVHHVMMLGGMMLYSAVRLSLTVGDFLTGSLMCMHASTPLLNLNWFLVKTERDDTTLGFVSKLLFALVFFTTRVLSWPFVMWLYMRMKNYGVTTLLSTLPKKCLVGTVIMMGLNLTWFAQGLKKLGKRRIKAA